MLKVKGLIFFVYLFGVVGCVKTPSVVADNLNSLVRIPVGGNAWEISRSDNNGEIISKEGIQKWTNLDHM